MIVPFGCILYLDFFYQSRNSGRECLDPKARHLSNINKAIMILSSSPYKMPDKKWTRGTFVARDWLFCLGFTLKSFVPSTGYFLPCPHTQHRFLVSRHGCRVRLLRPLSRKLFTKFSKAIFPGGPVSTISSCELLVQKDSSQSNSLGHDTMVYFPARSEMMTFVLTTSFNMREVPPQNICWSPGPIMI